MTDNDTVTNEMQNLNTILDEMRRIALNLIDALYVGQKHRIDSITKFEPINDVLSGTLIGINDVTVTCTCWDEGDEGWFGPGSVEEVLSEFNTHHDEAIIKTLKELNESSMD